MKKKGEEMIGRRRGRDEKVRKFSFDYPREKGNEEEEKGKWGKTNIEPMIIISIILV